MFRMNAFVYSFLVCLVSVASAKFPKDIQRCKSGDNDCIVAESNRVLHSFSKGHPGLNLIEVDPLHISEITLKQGSESPVNIELNFKETELIGLGAHDFYSIKYGRHATFNAILKRSLNTIGQPAIMEPPGLVREDGKRADGMTIFPWSKGRSLVWDATCIDTLAPSYVKRSAGKVAATANFAERKKNDLYKSIMINHEFVGFAVETLGPFSDGARRLVNDLGKQLIATSGDPRSKSFLIQRIGIEVQRGNAASILGTVPNNESLGEIFYL